MKYLNKLYESNSEDELLELLPNIPSNKKIISYSLWGDSEIYNYGMLENALWARKIFPGWTVEIRYKDNLIPKIKDALLKLSNVKMIEMKNSNNCLSNMMWRFIPAFEMDNIVIVRDSDSRFSIQEYNCVKEWVESDKDFHIIRWNHKKYKIAGGGWACRNGILYPFKNNIINDKKDPNYGYDIDWLENVIYKYIKNKAFVHCDGLACKGDKNNYPIYYNNQYEGKDVCKSMPQNQTEFCIIDENNCNYELASTLSGLGVSYCAPLACHYLNEIDGRLYSGRFFPKSGRLLLPGRVVDNIKAYNPHAKSKKEFINDRINFLKKEIEYYEEMINRSEHN